MLQIENLTFKIGDKQILNGVDLHVRAGESAVILGPSGEGKSTLLKSIVGLVHPQHGSIALHDRIVVTSRASAADWRYLRHHISIVFQNYPMFVHKTVLQNIVEPLRLVYKVDAKSAQSHALEALERLQLQDKAHSFPHELSGGQKQRVSIARTLAQKPDVVLFDEPTSALDYDLVSEVAHEIEELRASGIAVIVVTHDPTFARRVATKTYKLSQGILTPEQTRVGSFAGV